MNRIKAPTLKPEFCSLLVLWTRLFVCVCIVCINKRRKGKAKAFCDQWTWSDQRHDRMGQRMTLVYRMGRSSEFRTSGLAVVDSLFHTHSLIRLPVALYAFGVYVFSGVLFFGHSSSISGSDLLTGFRNVAHSILPPFAPSPHLTPFSTTPSTSLQRLCLA